MEFGEDLYQLQVKEYIRHKLFSSIHILTFVSLHFSRGKSPQGLEFLRTTQHLLAVTDKAVSLLGSAHAYIKVTRYQEIKC